MGNVNVNIKESLNAFKRLITEEYSVGASLNLAISLYSTFN